MKRSAFTPLLLVLVVLLNGCAPRELTTQEDIVALFNANKETLLSTVEKWDFSKAEEISGIQQIHIAEDGSFADFYCGGKGFGPETAYYGFFWSSDDDLTALDGGICAPEALVPSGRGFLWQEERGDNEYYVEPLGDHFFYYRLEF